MSRHSSAGNSGSSSWIFAILALAVLGSVLWIVRPSNGALEDAIPETAAPESPPPSEPPAPASLQEIDPGEAEARQPVEADGATPIAQDEEHPLRGRVVPNHYLPSDEVLEVSVEVWVPSSDEGSETDPNEWVRWFPGARKWREVTRLTPDASGRFSTPRPLDVSMVRLRVDGQYITGGEFEYKVGSEEEPGDGEFEMPACVGAHVTLRLDLDDIATQDEIAALEGDVLALSSTGSSSQNGFFSGSPFEREQKLNREGKAVFQGLSTYDWSEGHSMPTSEHQNLAPFRIKPGFHFEPSPGERVVIDVPMMRGLELQGVVLDGADQPIEGAEVVADLAWQAGSLSGTSRERRTTDAAGQFLFQALSDTPFGLEINAPGFLDFKIGSSDITPLIGTKEPNTFHLKRGRVLKVRVTDARGLPAHGLPIQLHKGTSKEALFNLRTDEHGLVEFIGLPSGPLSLSAKGRLRNELQKDPEERLRFLDCQHNPFGALPRTDLNVETLWYAQASVPVDQLESGETLELEVRIAPMVRGTVTGVDPAWTDPVRLAILQPDPNMPTFARRSMMGVRGEGTFAVDPDTGAFEGQLLPGHYTAIAYSGRRTNGLPTPTSTTMRSSPEIEFDVGTVDLNLNIPFARTRFIEGSVHLTDGTGLAELTVRLSKKEDWFTSAIGAATTNATGHFRFEADGPGTYHLRIDSPRYLLAQATQLEIKPGTTPPTQRLTAVQAGALRVNMVAVDGSPLVTTSVQVFKANGANTYARPIQHDPDWAGTFGPLAPGSYTVMVPQNLTEASTILHRKAFAIKPSEITEVTLHALDEPTATVSGTVTMSGKPIEDIAVWCSNDMGVIALNETDAEGHYTLALTEVGPMSLQYGPNRWTQIEQQAIDVAPGLNSMLPLSVPSGAIEGQFEGQPMMVFPALFRADAAEDEEAFRQCGSIMNGRFTISYLPDGLYNLTAIDREGKPSADYTPQTVEIKGGSVVRDLEVIPRE